MFSFKHGISWIQVHSVIKMTLKVAMGIWKLYHQINLDYLL